MGPRDGMDIFRKEKFIPPTGIQTPDPAAHSLVSVHTYATLARYTLLYTVG